MDATFNDPRLEMYINAINHLIKTRNNEEKKANMVSKKIKEEVNLDPVRDLHVSFQIIYSFVGSLANEEDPSKNHREIVKETLKHIDENLLNDVHATDMLAREFIRACKLFKMRFRMPDCLKELLRSQPSEVPQRDQLLDEVDVGFTIVRTISFSYPDETFVEDGMFVWDKALLETIRSMGYRSKANSVEYAKRFKELYKHCTENKKDPLAFWFNKEAATPEQPFIAGIAFKLLINAVYVDSVERNIIFKNKNVPALVTNVYKGAIQLFSPQNKIIEKDNQLQLYNTGELLGHVDIPTIEDSIANLVFKGMEKLRTVTSHRLIRFLIHSAFEKKIKGHEDFRLLVFERGATEIAELLGLSNKKYVSEINQILHALSHVHMNIQGFSGIFINLVKRESSRNQSNEYYITLSPPLVPYHANTLHKKTDNRLLIPILPDPPLVNPTQYYQSQFLLQLELMSEFSTQSKMLAQQGAVHIPQATWEEKALLSGINSKDVLIRVQDCWTGEGDFLEKVDTDFYTLTKKHEKALSFLTEQGKIRIKSSEQGKRANAKTKKIS
jgi:hypothetical protein